MASEFLQNLRLSNGFYHTNPILPEGSSGDGHQFSNVPSENFNAERLAFESIWKSEYHCPEILPYPTEIIEKLKAALSDQQDVIDQRVDEGKIEEHFTIQMYQMEIERVRFLICNYLKIRLKKIETLKEYLLSHHDMMLRLSTNERYFLSKLQNVDQQYIEETITKRLIPEEHHDIFLNNIANLTFSSPKFDAFVFCQTLEDVSGLLITSDRYQDCKIGDIFVVRYKVVRNLVLEGKVQLI